MVMHPKEPFHLGNAIIEIFHDDENDMLISRVFKGEGAGPFFKESIPFNKGDDLEKKRLELYEKALSRLKKISMLLLIIVTSRKHHK